jgi:ferredoxin
MRCVEGLVAVLVLTVTANAAEFKLTASDAAQADEFGSSVAISRDIVVVGARFDDDLGQASGSAYVYQRVGGQWVEQAKLTASDGVAFDFFGSAVAVDGDTIVVGAPQGGGDSGKAYVFQRSGGIWMEQAKLVADDPLRRLVGFGTAVAMVPDHIVVGAPYTEVSLQSTGSCYVFRRVGSAWQQEAALAPAVDVLQDRFGSSVAISGDLIGVGASEYLIGPGAAYTFRHDGSAWQEEAKLASASVSPQAQFGAAIAVDGQTLVVGAPDDTDNHPSGSGSVLVFERTGANWVEQPKLMASDVLSQPGFGSSVAVQGRDLAVDPQVAVVEAALCAGCRTCLQVCPYKAVSWNEEKASAEVADILCRGCGTCAAACPAGAVTARGFSREMLRAELEGVLS